MAGNKNSNQPFRVAVVGTGRISKFHFIAWRDAGDVEVVAVCDVDLDRAKKAAAEFGIAKAYASLTELLDRETVDAIDIATPPTTHGDLLAIAARYKIDCLCQKPLARNFDEAVRIVGDAKGKIRLCVNENRRHLPYYRTTRQWIAEGLIGKVQQGSMTAFRSSFFPGADGKYSGTPLLVKGPRLFISEAFIHQIDALRSMVGNIRLVASRSVPTEAALEGETMCTMMLLTTDGAPIVLSGSSVAVGYPREFNDLFEILGSKGSIVWDGSTLRLLGANAREVHFDMRGRYDEMYQSCFTIAAREFADAIRTGKPFPAEATDNLETLKIVEDAYRLNGMG
jgi:predicted dehydrogenase